MRGAAGAGLALLAAGWPGAAAAHDPFGLGSPVLAGAATAAAQPLLGVAAVALGAAAAAQRREGVALRAAIGLALALAAGAVLLLLLRWGPSPWGPTPALLAMAAGLAAVAPPRWPGPTLLPPLMLAGAALAMCTDLHAPFQVAAEMAFGAALGLPAAALIAAGAVRLVPEPRRRVVAGVIGAWSAAAGAIGLAFVYAA